MIILGVQDAEFRFSLLKILGDICEYGNDWAETLEELDHYDTEVDAQVLPGEDSNENV